MENVREKNSLVYYIESAIYKYDQIILVYAGFNKDNSKKVLDMIDDSINKLVIGDFSDELLKSAITDCVVVLEDSERTPSVVFNRMLYRYHFNSDTLEEKINNYKKVTKKDVMNLAKKVKKIKVVLLRDKNERV